MDMVLPLELLPTWLKVPKRVFSGRAILDVFFQGEICIHHGAWWALGLRLNYACRGCLMSIAITAQVNVEHLLLQNE